MGFENYQPKKPISKKIKLSKTLSEVKPKIVPPKVEKPAQPARVSQTSHSSISGCGELRSKLASLGVPSNQLNSAISLASKESGCSSSAVNSSSGACGSFQSLPCGKWGSPGTTQYLRGAINYANSNYGGFNGAWSHSSQNNWY